MQAYIIGLSINKNLKLKKGKGKDKWQREELYMIPQSRKSHASSTSIITSTITTVFCQCRNITPPSSKACPQALYICIIPIGRSYLYTPLVAYYLYYTSIPSIYLGTLVVLVYQGNGYKIFKAYGDY